MHSWLADEQHILGEFKINWIIHKLRGKRVWNLLPPVKLNNRQLLHWERKTVITCRKQGTEDVIRAISGVDASAGAIKS